MLNWGAEGGDAGSGLRSPAAAGEDGDSHSSLISRGQSTPGSSGFVWPDPRDPCTEPSSLLSRAVADRSRLGLGSLLGRWSRSGVDVGRPSEVTIRKSKTVVSLAPPPNGLPVTAYNRLRRGAAPPSLLCSRCSSILSMASSSRYSVNDGQYVAVGASGSAGTTPTSVTEPPMEEVLCKLCLCEVSYQDVCRLNCECFYCYECTKKYIEHETREGAYEISCPDPVCRGDGIITLGEIESIADPANYEKHLRFRRNLEVEQDPELEWCPGLCETACRVVGATAKCPTCSTHFCVKCRGPAHPAGAVCAGPGPAALPFADSDLIKCCPMCNVPIEKDDGCAQMMCKRCKHVFCWYCLASLDDDFLLRHYDKGPCKNKLGHSRASVIWHRTQVIGIFAGFGILLLVASPLLLLAAPCIVCCKCRLCSGRNEEDSPAVADPTPIVSDPQPPSR